MLYNKNIPEVGTLVSDRLGNAENPYNSVRNDLNREEPSLTADIMGHTGGALDAASRIHGQLYDLRNRLFGYPPAKEQARGVESSATSWSEAYRERAEALSEFLLSIELLAMELAKRF